ncbi:MAG: fused response regulator/phosphatase [Betaproteobacteria bacterium]|nr:fused response regulator/phosphatase [Betaproteobacteria bacterium]
MREYMSQLEVSWANTEGVLGVWVVTHSEALLAEAKRHFQGHRVREACVLAQDSNFLEEALPNLVVLDMALPNDGAMEWIPAIRSWAGERWIPIVLAGTRDSHDAMVRALSMGADDFLMLPLRAELLGAKIRGAQHAARLHAKLSETSRGLERHRQESEAELVLARNLIQHMIDLDGLADPVLEWCVMPSAKFSGDIFASTRHGEDRLYVFFADSSGHGLAAAISGLPVLQVFYAMAGKGVSVGEIAREMNAKLKDYLPVGRFLAALLICVDYRAEQVDAWNGGMPEGMFLVNGVPQPGELLKSRHIPLGIEDKDHFDASCSRFSWAGPARLLFVSDGLVEATGPFGQPFGYAILEEIARRNPSAGVVAPVLQALRAYLQGAAAQDDASIFGVTLD